ncbi:hypothetical protein ABIA00_000268 [Bradyrhizobium ottawaense]
MPIARDPLYRRHRFPPEVISYAVWLYFRFPLSLRMVEEMLAARGIGVTYRAGPGCLDSAPLDLSGFLPGYAERGASSATVMRPSP